MFTAFISLVGGILIAGLLVLLIVFIISSQQKQPSVLSWISIGIMSIGIIISGASFCGAVDVLISLDDEKDDVEMVANDAVSAISSLVDKEGAKALNEIKGYALGGSNYYYDVAYRQAKRTLWRSSLWTMAIFIVFGSIAIVTAEGKKRNTTRQSYRSSRNESRYRSRR